MENNDNLSNPNEQDEMYNEQKISYKTRVKYADYE